LGEKKLKYHLNLGFLKLVLGMYELGARVWW
jgi:hypothetical protein